MSLAEMVGLHFKTCKPSIHTGFKGAAFVYVSSFVSANASALTALSQATAFDSRPVLFRKLGIRFFPLIEWIRMPVYDHIRECDMAK